MENFMISNQTRMPPSIPSALSIHKDSQSISKAKPKIRIIHIFAPEVIKTDVENFRELVQRLTGKPPHEKGFKKKQRIPRRGRYIHKPRVTGFGDKPLVEAAAMAAKKMELRTGFLAGLETVERVKEEEEDEGMLWSNIGENPGGFLSDLDDFDGFIQELGEFPLLPLDASHLMHGFEDAQPA